MRYKILKYKSDILKEIKRVYGDVPYIEDILEGKKDYYVYKDKENNENITFMYLEYYYEHRKNLNYNRIVLLSCIDIDEYIFHMIMLEKPENIMIYVNESVSNLYMHYFNSKMKYRIGCKKYMHG